MPGMQPSTNSGTIAFEVDNVDELTERLRSRGTPVQREPIQSPVCRMSVVHDPEGNGVLLHQLTPKVTPPA